MKKIEKMYIVKTYKGTKVKHGKQKNIKDDDNKANLRFLDISYVTEDLVG